MSLSKVIDPLTEKEVETIAASWGGYRIISSPDLQPGEVRFFVKRGVIVVGAGEGVDVLTKKPTLDELRAQAANLRAEADRPVPPDPDEEARKLEAEIAALKAKVASPPLYGDQNAPPPLLYGDSVPLSAEEQAAADKVAADRAAAYRAAADKAEKQAAADRAAAEKARKQAP